MPLCPSHLILPPAYLPPVAYYVAKSLATAVSVDYSMPFNKRAKDVHRCTITDANGIIRLTIPIEKPQSATTALWSDIIISGHNRWWDIHLTALKSAYGRTPFFEYYLHDFLPFYQPDVVGQPLVHYLRQMDALLTRLLGVDMVRQQRGIAEALQAPLPVEDYRRRPIELQQSIPYYQQRTGGSTFTPGLSAVDLLFNAGPESPLTLLASQCTIHNAQCAMHN